MSLKMLRFLLPFFCIWFLPAVLQAQERTVVDELGYSFTTGDYPRRVVSLAPEVTEIIYACGCGGKLVAVSEYSDYPEAARSLPQVGSYARPDLEKIVSFAPDMVVGSASGNAERTISRLRELGIKVYVIFPRGVKGALKSLASIANLLGCGEQGKRYSKSLAAAFDSYRALPVEKSHDAVILFNLEPPVSSGADTLSDDLLSWVGFRNILHDSSIRYPAVSLEWLVAENPEFVFLAIQSGDGKAAEELFQRFSGMQAVRKKQVITINPDLISRAGPRLVEAAALLRGALLDSRGKKH